MENIEEDFFFSCESAKYNKKSKISAFILKDEEAWYNLYMWSSEKLWKTTKKTRSRIWGSEGVLEVTFQSMTYLIRSGFLGTAQQLKLKLKYLKASVLDYQNVDADQQVCVTSMWLGNCNFGQMNLQ